MVGDSGLGLVGGIGSVVYSQVSIPIIGWGCVSIGNLRSSVLPPL